MKKIALLFTLLCASALNGMEQPEQGRYAGLGELSPEIQVLIIQALNTFDKYLSSKENLTNTVNAIKAMTETNKQLHAVVNDMYGNLKGFTALIGILAEKFFAISRDDIAYKFNTPLAEEYKKLGNKLLNNIFRKPIEKITQLIKQGADVNYNKMILIYAVSDGDVNLVKLLLDAGANPFIQYNKDQTVFEIVQQEISWARNTNNEERLSKMNAIKVLLEDAMKKQQK